MTTVESIVKVVTGAGGERLSTGQDDIALSEVRLLEDDASIDRCVAGSVAMLTAHASAAVRGFRFESLLARASHHHVAIVIVVTSSVLTIPRYSPATQAVCVLRVPADADLGGLIVDISRVMTQGDAAALLRARRGREILDRASSAATTTQSVSLELTDLLPDLRLGPPAEGRVEVSSPGSAGELVWSVPDAGEPYSSVDALLLRAMSALDLDRGLQDAPDRALSTVITEMLVTRGDTSNELGDRGRVLGFDAHGWHAILAVSVHPTGPHITSAVDQIRLEEQVSATALRVAQTTGAVWRSAHVGTTLLLVCTWARNPGAAGEDRVRVSASTIFSSLTSLSDRAQVSCGLSRVHSGEAGLRLASAEARSSMRTAPRARSSLTAFDGFGLDRALLDWFALEESQELARRLLAPFRAMPADKAETLMMTLQSYLDNQGSVNATATALFIHRNAVGYRLNTIKRVLQTDLSDPDERLALQLACRGRGLLTG